MVTAAEEEKGRLTMRVKTAEGMVLVKTPGTYRQASNCVNSVHYLSKYADTLFIVSYVQGPIQKEATDYKLFILAAEGQRREVRS